MQERFRWNATAIQADAAKALVLLNENNFLAVIGRVKRRGITARPGADDDDFRFDWVHLELNLVLFEIFERLNQVDDKPRCAPAVDDAMIIRNANRRHHPRFNLSLSHHGLLCAAPQAENRDFGPVNDRREMCATNPALVGNRETAALHFFEAELALPRLVG